VLLERPGVDFFGSLACLNLLEPLAGVLVEGLSAGLDALAAAAAEAELGAFRFGVVE